MCARLTQPARLALPPPPPFTLTSQRQASSLTSKAIPTTRCAGDARSHLHSTASSSSSSSSAAPPPAVLTPERAEWLLRTRAEAQTQSDRFHRATGRETLLAFREWDAAIAALRCGGDGASPASPASPADDWEHPPAKRQRRTAEEEDAPPPASRKELLLRAAHARRALVDAYAEMAAVVAGGFKQLALPQAVVDHVTAAPHQGRGGQQRSGDAVPRGAPEDEQGDDELQ